MRRLDLQVILGTFAIAFGSLVVFFVMLHYRSNGRGCDQSLTDSNGFMCLSDSMWAEKKRIFRLQTEHQFTSNSVEPNTWIAQNAHPVLTCALEERLGGFGDGGKWICDPSTLAKQVQVRKQTHPHLDPPCLIYSFGSNDDFSYEESMHERFPDCGIFVFDHTGDAHPPPYVTFSRWGLAGQNFPPDNATGNGPMYTLETIMGNLGHRGRTIDILKVDVEGWEFVTFVPLFQEHFLPFHQLQIEIHLEIAKYGQWFFQQMLAHHLVIFHKEPNVMQGCGGMCAEYSLIKMAPSWFEGP